MFQNPGDLHNTTYPTEQYVVDLDNDGDADLVTNRINEPAGVYRNNSKNHFIKIKLKGFAQNTSAIGAKVTVTTTELKQFQEQYPTRGFQSSVAHELLFGIGSSTIIEEISVVWPDEKISVLKNIKADSTIEISYQQDLIALVKAPVNTKSIFQDVKCTNAISISASGQSLHRL